jgi:phosphoserine phosphatase RsbU/P
LIKDDTVEYVNAGHTELLVKRPGSTTKIVQTKHDNFKGLFLGVKEMEADYRCVSFKIIQGDCLILYTDYLIEAMNSQNEEFGLERLASAINSVNSELSARAIASSILKAVEEFTEGRDLTDDCTLIVLKRK